jgi:hypothetical protein
MRCCCDTDPPSLRCANCNRGNHEACWDIIYPKPKSPPPEDPPLQRLSVAGWFGWVISVALGTFVLAYMMMELTR